MVYVDMLFWDSFAGKMVCHYRDTFGRDWMATSRWSFFRVKKNSYEGPNDLCN